ncbi:zinc finger protein SNAI2-like [Cimex lectularius]|uniref:C2H2-type domain-containing protein n=1 Tax=Cimex lectularius TaxID=79782 RepID=A0A8I6RWW1_CIMLE|nr:zinc finger protein SNAI2-like [Cimex lectularius]
MHIVNDEPSIPRTLPFKKSNYSHCPLKKRPVPLMVKDDSEQRDVSDDNSEPENLSTKPEDLTCKSLTPSIGVALISAKKEPQSPQRTEESTMSLGLPYSGSFLAKSGPLEPLNLNTQSELQAWPRPYYPSHYIPLNYHYSSDLYNYYNDKYTPSPSPPQQPPFLPVQPKPMYMTYSGECVLSPASSTSSYGGLYSQSPTTPEDLSSPGSVGSSSPPRKNKDSPRYQCVFCNKSYTTYSGLSKHQQFHCSANEDSTAKKSFSCKHCDKVYFSLGALKMHIRTHTLPCKCKLCGKAFSRPWLLQGHIRTHTGEKPFTCPHCNRAFADRSNLRAHLQTHSDVKKYSCPTCSKTFSRMSLLTKHVDGGCPGTNSTTGEDMYKQEMYSN